ncbi:MAG: quinoprotein dehydrogenase-associated putative ABC transporter substrate-binding protein [Polaromonas sp.]
MLTQRLSPTCLMQCMTGVWLAGLLVFPAIAQDQLPSGSEQKVLRVCQDPNNLPMSDQQEHGYENRIAALFAQKLGWKLEHTWYPQRMGFIRNTLKAKIPDSDTFKCDIVTGVSTDFDIGLATKPYLFSTYALAYVKGRGLDEIKTPEDLLKLNRTTRDKLRIGIFARSPASDWLLKNGLIDQMVSFQPQTGDPEQYPGQLIDRDLASGKIDVAIAWGPIVGYFANHSGGAVIEVVPFPPEADGIRYGFGIAMGVRYGEKVLRDQLNTLIQSCQPEIAAILKEYAVPTVPFPIVATKPAAPS